VHSFALKASRLTHILHVNFIELPNQICCCLHFHIFSLLKFLDNVWVVVLQKLFQSWLSIFYIFKFLRMLKLHHWLEADWRPVFLAIKNKYFKG
jgi:hypothetical protein